MYCCQKCNRHIDVYLASPYTHPDPVVRHNRAAIVSQLAFKEFMLKGLSVYCPIAETVFIAQFGDHSDTGWDFWRKQDLPKLNSCKTLVIAMIDGWKESKGIRGEVKFAMKNNIPIEFIRLNGDRFVTNVLDMFDVKSIEELND